LRIRRSWATTVLDGEHGLAAFPPVPGVDHLVPRRTRAPEPRQVLAGGILAAQPVHGARLRHRGPRRCPPPGRRVQAVDPHVAVGTDGQPPLNAGAAEVGGRDAQVVARREHAGVVEDGGPRAVVRRPAVLERVDVRAGPVDARRDRAVVQEPQHVVVVVVEAEVSGHKLRVLGERLRRDQCVHGRVEALPHGAAAGGGRVRDDEVAVVEEGDSQVPAARLARPHRRPVGVDEVQVAGAAERYPRGPAVHGHAGARRPHGRLVRGVGVPYGEREGVLPGLLEAAGEGGVGGHKEGPRVVFHGEGGAGTQRVRNRRRRC
jgi:hypothetical protein